MSDQGRQAAKVAALVAGGAVIGAGIGLLFAPQTGTETRREVRRYARKAQLQATRWNRTVQSGMKEVVIAVSLSFARTMRPYGSKQRSRIASTGTGSAVFGGACSCLPREKRDEQRSSEFRVVS